jgi:hypothetical protein
MRETVFEGVPARVPYAFDKILTEEYSARALTKTYHAGYVSFISGFGAVLTSW